MAGDRMICAAGSPVDAYLGELAGLLRGPRRRRSRIIAELTDGLEHAVQGRVAGGMPRAEAEREAVVEFGTPRLVAAAWAGELGTAYARRIISLYIVTGPLVGIWWLMVRQPQPWHKGLIALVVAIPVLPLVGVAIVTAMTALATTGRLIRWIPEASPHRAITAVLAVAGLVLAVDTTIIVSYVWSGGPWRLLAVIAIAASLVRIVCGVWTLRDASLMWRVTGEQAREHRGGGHAGQ
jgi:hypothetical protein